MTITKASRNEELSCDVLIVDDEQTIRNPLKRLLENHFPGCRVAVAANGIDAALRLSRLRPTVVLLDLVMPGSDGWQLLDQVRLDSDLASTRFVVVSGHMDTELVERAYASEVPFVLKPFDLETRGFADGVETRPASTCEVLVVDDEPAIQSLFKRLLEYADTQFIIVSGQGSNESVYRAYALGIPYLAKLGDLNELVAVVEQRLADAKRRT
jgi:CheY-like chemotaxis protein